MLHSNPLPTLSTPIKPTPSEDENSASATVSVYVAIRLRPAIQPSEPAYEAIPALMRSSAVEDISPTLLSIKNAQTRKRFHFDQILDQNTSQAQLWDHIATGMHSFLAGYNVSIMAYGQSGSGKSYTMGTNGPSLDEPSTGVIPRAAEFMFPKLQALKSESASYALQVSYLEIYNEQIRDLLKPNNTLPINVRETAKGEISFTGLSQLSVASVDELLHQLNIGSRSRQTSPTAINAQSSRSHAIFTVYLTKKTHTEHEITGKWSAASETLSKLNFVDLAGSERLKTTGAVGEQAREGISINSGLANLGKVIAQLSERTVAQPSSPNHQQPQQHISYRDSKLTRVLQDSLGKRAITYLIACITCEQFYYSETLNTLTYAQRARAIQSTPEITKIESGAFLTQAIKRLENEVEYWKQRVKRDAIDPLVLKSQTNNSTLAQDNLERSLAIQSAVMKTRTDNYESTIQALQASLAQSYIDYQDLLNERKEDVQLLTEKILRLQLELGRPIYTSKPLSTSSSFSSSSSSSSSILTSVDESMIVIKRSEYDGLKRQIATLRNELRAITKELHQMRATNQELNLEISQLYAQWNPVDVDIPMMATPTVSLTTSPTASSPKSRSFSMHTHTRRKSYGNIGVNPILTSLIGSPPCFDSTATATTETTTTMTTTTTISSATATSRHRRSRSTSGGYHSLSLQSLNVAVVRDSSSPRLAVENNNNRAEREVVRRTSIVIGGKRSFSQGEGDDDDQRAPTEDTASLKLKPTLEFPSESSFLV